MQEGGSVMSVGYRGYIQHVHGQAYAIERFNSM